MMGLMMRYVLDTKEYGYPLLSFCRREREREDGELEDYHAVHRSRHQRLGTTRSRQVKIVMEQTQAFAR